MDTAAPQTQVDSGPTGPTNDTTPTFDFSATGGGTSFQCRFDSASFGACSGPGNSHTPATPLGEGPHTFEVRATDQAGNTDPTPASQSFTVDTAAPQTQVDSGPTGPTNDTTPTFDFSATGGATGFECRFDSASFGACSGPGNSHTAATALGDGAHTFEVRARDQAGNTDPTPASQSFTVDTVAPVTSVDAGPSGLTSDSTPTFDFSATGGATGFECRFDSASFGACSGPGNSHTAAPALGEGPHTFEVRARDQAGNTDQTPASRSFTVDTGAPVAPSITDTDPDSPANDNNPEIKGSAEAGSTVRIYSTAGCTGSPLASGPAATFSGAGITTPVPGDATTNLRATATDGSNNTSGCSSALAYTEDSSAPATPSVTDTDPDSPSSDQNPEVKGTADSGSTVRIYSTADLHRLAACDRQRRQLRRRRDHDAGAENQTTNLRATASDAAGNASGCSTALAYTEDSSGPGTPSITDTDPDSPANDNNPEVRGTGAEAGLDRPHLRRRELHRLRARQWQRGDLQRRHRDHRHRSRRPDHEPPRHRHRLGRQRFAVLEPVRLHRGLDGAQHPVDHRHRP